MRSSASQINNAIKGFTDVFVFSISRRTETDGYDLVLVLNDPGLSAVRLECVDVSNLAMTHIGGGLTQFLCLRAEDVGDAQLDRVAIRFADLERGSIAFDCSSATTRPTQLV